MFFSKKFFHFNKLVKRPRRHFCTRLNRLKIGIVGSGPAGFYSAIPLLEKSKIDLEIDMIDKLPTPFGLVRSGLEMMKVMIID